MDAVFKCSSMFTQHSCGMARSTAHRCMRWSWYSLKWSPELECYGCDTDGGIKCSKWLSTKAYWKYANMRLLDTVLFCTQTFKVCCGYSTCAWHGSALVELHGKGIIMWACHHPHRGRCDVWVHRYGRWRVDPEGWRCDHWYQEGQQSSAESIALFSYPLHDFLAWWRLVWRFPSRTERGFPW